MINNNTVLIKQKKEKDWFRVKQYSHIGLRLSKSDEKWVKSYITNRYNIETHAFFPFIHRELSVRKFRREIAHDGTRSKLRKPSTKNREIYFANHIDSNIYGYYADKLSKHYEAKLKEKGISDCVTAYRRVKLDPESPKSRNKNNIDFANDVFSYIKNQKEKNIVAITFDISSFFDNLDHTILKKQWRFITDSGANLNKDYYNVFRNITKFSYIEESDIFKHFKDEILVERNSITGKNKKVIKTRKVKRLKYFKNQRAVAYCTQKEIYELRNNNLIKANKYIFDKETGSKLSLRNKGIPQGSPISSVLANVYMLEFDEYVNNFMSEIGGVYQRYSDDMVVVCDNASEKQVIDMFMSKIKDYKLDIQKRKTQVFHFKWNSKLSRHSCIERNVNTGQFRSGTNFEYLGFQFDGYYTLLKSASLASYYRKMKRGIRRGVYYSIHNNTNTKGKIFKSRLYKRYTYKGAERRRVYQRDRNDSSRFVLTNRQDWGNYLSYAKMAERIIPDNKIKSQIKNHWKIFHGILKSSENKDSDLPFNK